MSWTIPGFTLFHCKRRNQGCSSVQRRSSTANSGTKVAVLLGINSKELVDASALVHNSSMDQELDTKLKGFPVPHARGLWHSSRSIYTGLVMVPQFIARAAILGLNSVGIVVCYEHIFMMNIQISEVIEIFRFPRDKTRKGKCLQNCRRNK